jgi:hypothetical protein
MTLFKAIFGSGNAQAVVATLPEPPFSERALVQLNLLDKLVKENSNEISTEVYSKLRDLDDILRPLIEYLKTHQALQEQETLIESAITDYIPTPLDTFKTLPDSDKEEGGQGDLLLLRQYATIETNIRKLADEIYGRVLKELGTQAIFIDDKFNAGG